MLMLVRMLAVAAAAAVALAAVATHRPSSVPNMARALVALVALGPLVVASDLPIITFFLSLVA